MKIVIGLGNPGVKYGPTRHNIGFRVVDYLAAGLGVSPFVPRWQGLWSRGVLNGISFGLLKPQTFMNCSGESIQNCLDGLETEAEVLVIADDVALPLGRLRCRARGSAGGHNGLASIEMALATTEYARLRVGVAPDECLIAGEELIEFVLGPFSGGEEALLTEVIPAAAEAARLWIESGVEACQQSYNGWRPVSEEKDDVDITVESKMEE